jgi:hypothetical protein
MAALVEPFRVRVHKNVEEWLEAPDVLTDASDHDIKVVGALAEA